MNRLDIDIIQKALEQYIADYEHSTNGDLAWNAHRAKKVLILFGKKVDMKESYGGAWLGCVREWIQRKFVNGDRVMWGSLDSLHGATLRVKDLENLAEDVATAAINDYLGV